MEDNFRKDIVKVWLKFLREDNVNLENEVQSIINEHYTIEEQLQIEKEE